VKSEVAALLQLLREYPPGYGGVERVAHELGERYGGSCLSLAPPSVEDSLPVSYRRHSWPVLSLGRLRLPLPLPEPLALLQQNPSVLLLHLPCPSLVLLGLVIRLLQPHRPIHLYWHAFVDQRHWWLRIYECVALVLARQASTVISTSPPLIELLAAKGIQPTCLVLLPPALPQALEAALMQTPPVTPSSPLRILCLGRLDSYKRPEWLIQAISVIPDAHLTIIGKGPNQQALERLGAQLGLTAAGRLQFLGKVSECMKSDILAKTHVLVLPSASCHEAFGIVQLEAMAAGRVALCMRQQRSGTAWVNGLEVDPHHPCRTQIDLVEMLQRLLGQPEWLRECAQQARFRYQLQFSRARWHARCRILEHHLPLHMK